MYIYLYENNTFNLFIPPPSPFHSTVLVPLPISKSNAEGLSAVSKLNNSHNCYTVCHVCWWRV